MCLSYNFIKVEPLLINSKESQMVFYKKFLMVAVLGVSLTQVVIAMDENQGEASASASGGTKQKEVISGHIPLIVEEKELQRKEYVEATAQGIHIAAGVLNEYAPPCFQPLVGGAEGTLMNALTTMPVQNAVELVGRTGQTVLDSHYVKGAIVKGTPKATAALAYVGPLASQAFDEAKSLYGRWTQRKGTVNFATTEAYGLLCSGFAWVRSFCPGKQKIA